MNVRTIIATATVLSILSVSCFERRQDDPGVIAPSTGWDRVSKTHHLRVGYIVFPPAVVKDPRTGALGGHFVTSMNDIAKQAGWTTEYVPSDWATFAAGLDAGKFDVSIAPTFVTIPRATAVSFSRPLFYAGNSAIVRKGDARFPSLASLNRGDIQIAVTQGEAGYEFAKQNLPLARLSVHPGPDQSLTFTDVLAGRADIALGDAYATAQFAAAHADAEDLFATHPYNLTPVSWAVASRDARLLQFVNDAIEALDSQGKLLEYEKAAGAHWLHDKRTLALEQ
jgi:polar amino acid transport system substrate-binding protein